MQHQINDQKFFQTEMIVKDIIIHTIYTFCKIIKYIVHFKSNIYHTEARFSTDSFIFDKPKRVIPSNSPRLVIKSAISIGCLGSIDIP